MSNPSFTAVLSYVLGDIDSYRDNIGEIILTWVDEDVMNHFDMDDDDYENADYSFRIYKALERQKLI